MLRLPFHVAKYIGFSLLFAVLASVLLFSHQHHYESAKELRIIIDSLTPQDKSLRNINTLLLIANQQFQIYRRMEQIDSEDLLNILDRLHKKTKIFENQMIARGLPFAATTLLKPITIVRASLYRHVQELERSGDPSNDTSVSLLERLDKALLLFKERMWQLSSNISNDRLIPQELLVARSTNEQLLDIFELTLKQYLDQEYIDLSEAITAIQRAQTRLTAFRLDYAIYNNKRNIDEQIVELQHFLRQYRYGLSRYLDEKQYGGEHTDTLEILEKMVNQAWIHSEQHLNTINHHLQEHINMTHQRLIERNEARQQQFLWISALAFSLALLISRLLEMTLNARINLLSRGAQAFSAGRLEHRIILPSKDAFARLGNLFNQMADDRKHYEEVIETERRYVENVIENSMNMIIAINLQRQIVVFNRAAQQTFGYSLDEVTGKSGAFLYGNHEDQKRVVDSLSQDGRFSGEVINQRKNGELFPAFLTAVVLYDEDGAFNGVVGNSREITAEKEMEAIRLAKDVAEKANQTKSEFLANMSHEIRTPMNAIIGLADLAITQPMPPKIQDYLSKIGNAAHSLLRIINDILDCSKIDAGKMTLEPTDFYLCDTLDHVADLFRNQAAENGVELILTLSKECRYPLRGDALRLGQILTNLVGNALKFTEKGGIEVKVHAIEIGDEKGDEKQPFATQESEWLRPIVLEFSVRDSGIGMSQNQVAKLFQAFVQADGSTTRKYGGTGLGLTISKRLVEMMDGNIWVESSAGSGSIFRFTVTLEQHLPAEKEQLPIPEVMHSINNTVDTTQISNHVAGAKVLLVEDNAINQQVAGEILSGVGLIVEMANNGVAAVKMVTEKTYDMVLMDIQMPEMDGYTATQQIRAAGGFEELPIIAMTAHAMSGDREKSLAAGMNDHISKPIDKRQLYAALIHWIPAREKGSITSVASQPQPGVDTHKIQQLQTMLPPINVADVMQRINHNEKLLHSILFEFHRDFANVTEEIQAAIQRNQQDDWATAQRLAHSVKGVAGNLSAKALYDAALTLEKTIQEEKREILPTVLNAFDQLVTQMLTSIEPLKQQQKNNQHPESMVVEGHDQNAIKPLVVKLSQLLHTSDSYAQDTYDTLKPLLVGNDPKLLAVLHRLEEQLDIFDFHEAQLSLQELATNLEISLDTDNTDQDG